MALRHIPLDQLKERDLLNLIAGGVVEQRDIEYKAATYGGNDDARKEFLADISSFANSQGGDIVVGMKAENGVAADHAPTGKRG